MRYRAKGFLIHSENAAKPAGQASEYVVCLLRRLGPFRRALDYGCGKLRYAVHLANQSGRLTLVDSEIQLSRRQVLCGESTDVRAYVAAHFAGARVKNDQEFLRDKSRYDFALCANVLSAIPHARRRHRVVSAIADRLTKRGRALFICQHTNSYFCDHMRDRTVHKFGDGFLVQRPGGKASFYGIIKPADLRRLVVRAGMVIADAWIHDQSGYLVAQRF